jgi:hypothetical protein
MKLLVAMLLVAADALVVPTSRVSRRVLLGGAAAAALAPPPASASLSTELQKAEAALLSAGGGDEATAALTAALGLVQEYEGLPSPELQQELVSTMRKKRGALQGGGAWGSVAEEAYNRLMREVDPWRVTELEPLFGGAVLGLLPVCTPRAPPEKPHGTTRTRTPSTLTTTDPHAVRCVLVQMADSSLSNRSFRSSSLWRTPRARRCCSGRCSSRSSSAEQPPPPGGGGTRCTRRSRSAPDCDPCMLKRGARRAAAKGGRSSFEVPADDACGPRPAHSTRMGGAPAPGPRRSSVSEQSPCAPPCAVGAARQPRRHRELVRQARLMHAALREREGGEGDQGAGAGPAAAAARAACHAHGRILCIATIGAWRPG